MIEGHYTGRGEDRPLISCIVPTADRRAAISLLITALREQTIRGIELVVVDGGRVSVEDLVRTYTPHQYVRVPRRMSLGAQRNLACEAATGTFVAHWDDDDWFAPDRLERQVGPLLRDDADVTGVTCPHILDLRGPRWWALDPQFHDQLFLGGVHGATLCFRRSLLSSSVRYPSVRIAEDKFLLAAMLKEGARIERIDGTDLFAYVRHASNTWRFVPGKYIRSRAWLPGVSPSGMSEEVIGQYRAALVVPRGRGSHALRKGAAALAPSGSSDRRTV